MNVHSPISAVVVGCMLVGSSTGLGCKSKSDETQSAGKHESSPENPTLGPPAEATCEAPSGLPAGFELGPKAVVTKAENYHWDWKVEYEVPDSAAEVERLLAERKAKGWTVMSARDEDASGIDLSAFAYRGEHLLYVTALNVGDQNDVNLRYGIFPRDLSALMKGVHLTADAKLRSVEWTPTLHSLFMVFGSDVSAKDYTAAVEANLKSIGWSAVADERDGTYETRELEVVVGLRTPDDGTLGIFVTDETCKRKKP